MKKGTTEFYDILAAFEKLEKCGPEDRANRDTTFRQDYYNNGALNDKFKAFFHGVSFGRSYWQGE